MKYPIIISNKVKFCFRLFMTLVMLFLVFRFVGFNKMQNALNNIDIYLVLASILVGMVSIFFIALRWKTIIRIFSADIGLRSSLTYILISFMFGLITPGRLGEFIKVKYLSDKTKIGYLKSLATVIIDRIFDVLILALFILIGFSFSKKITAPNELLLFLLFLYSLFLAGMFIWFRAFYKLIMKIIPKKWEEGIIDLHIGRSVYIKSLGYSLLIWLIISVQAFFILLSLGISLPLPALISIVPLLTLSSMLPISIGGIGIREAISIYFLLNFSVSAENSALFSLLLTFSGLGIPAAIGAVLYARKALSRT